MSMTGVATIDRTVQKTNGWLKDLMEEMDWHDREKAYQALRVTLQALRDRLTVAEAAELGAQLPTLVRGFYFEGWRPAGKPVRERHKKEFLEHIAKAMRGDPWANPEEVARSVFRVLARHVSAGEIEDVRNILPHEIRELFPEIYA